jgi:hypothetical protein
MAGIDTLISPSLGKLSVTFMRAVAYGIYSSYSLSQELLAIRSGAVVDLDEKPI